MINRIVLLGPPASGKGTQTALLSATFGIPYTEEALDRRLEQYREQTLPVAHHYQGKGLLREVDVTAGRDAVFNRLYGDIRGELSE